MYDVAIYCSCRCNYIHRHCFGLSKDQYEYVRFDTSWYCKYTGEVFPFTHIDDDCIFLIVIRKISTSTDSIFGYNSRNKIFKPFEINKDGSNILGYQGDLNPDKCFFNQYLHKCWEICTYQTEHTFNNYVSRTGSSTTTFLYSISA